MSRRTLTTIVPLALALASAAACSDHPTEPRDDDSQITADLAASAGEEIAGDVSLLTWGATEATNAGGFGPITSSGSPPCPFAAGRFTCATMTAGAYTFDRSYQMFDAAGNVQSAYDDATTASIQFRAALQGSTTLPSLTATVAAQREATVTGLAGSETQREWNGTGSSTVTSQVTRESVTRSYSYSSSDAISHLVFALPRATHPYPMSGQITRDVSATLTREGGRTVSRSVRRHVVATFDGTSAVQLQVGTRSCTLVLDAKSVSCGG